MTETLNKSKELLTKSIDKIAASVLADRFEAMAARLAEEVHEKRLPRRSHTPKQNRQARQARIESDHLERAQLALQYLAKAHRDGTITTILSGIRTRKQVLEMTRTGIGSRSYYDVYDTGEYHDKSPEAIALRKFIEESKGEEQRKRDEQRQRKSRIDALEDKVRFVDIPGFFPTPIAVVEHLIDLAQIEPGMMVLEPSAGKGDIADGIAARFDVAICGAYCPTKDKIGLKCFEICPALVEILRAKGHDFNQLDFLDETIRPVWDRIVMNPPFERGQDIDHVRHAYEFLKPGGRLVAIMSSGSFSRQDRKTTDFLDWLSGFNLGAEDFIKDLPEDSFKDAFRSTGVNSKVLVLNKPA